MTEALERIVDAERFSMQAFCSDAWLLIEADPAITTALLTIRRHLSNTHYRKLQYGIVRQVFLIELVKQPKIETTKFRVRWFPELSQDPRGCSYDECLQIARSLLIELATNLLNDPSKKETLTLYDLPPWYRTPS